MKLKRLLTALLTAASLFALTAAPAQAGYFPDIADSEVSRAADTLYALGIVDGMADGTFQPGGHLSRVQFCKMAIEIMGKGAEATAQMNRTIFTDVGGTHWGRGYANLAATMVLDEKTGTRLMMGTGNGRFEPERDISYQEAITLILRMLGYSAEADRSWPAGAIQEAAALGLDEGLSIADPSGPLTRGQAALLFCRLLSIPAKGEEKPYAQSLGTLVEDVIILSTNATINGQSGWVMTTKGGPYRSAGMVDAELVGQRGDILLDKDGRFITLLADESSCVTAALSRIQGNYLYTRNGTRYTMEDSTPVYSGTSGEVSTYAEMLPSILPGDVVTLYLDEGKVIGMFRSATTVESNFLIAQEPITAASLFSLTGGEYNYTIRKNGSNIALREINEYDVLTYDAVSRVVYVCDTRISCEYENASPSPSAPSTITVLGGNTFDVMADAMDDLSDFRIGQSFTLLFTSDGRVAGAVRRGVSGNAMGVVSGNELDLIGINKTLSLKRSADAADLDGQLVSVSGSDGQIDLRRLSLSSRAGDFEKYSMRLGKLSVSDSVQIYERGSNGLAAVSLSSLPSSVPSSKISGYYTDSSGNVSLIILRSYTGDGNTYGLIESTSRFVMAPVKGEPVCVDDRQYFWDEVDKTVSNSRGTVVLEHVYQLGQGTLPEDCQYVLDESGNVLDKATLYQVDASGRLLSSDGSLLDKNGKPIQELQEIPQLKFSVPGKSTTYDVEEGERVREGFGTISTYTDRDSGETYASVDSTLTRISGVRSADFYTVEGITYVQADGTIYQVADDVLCYNSTASYGYWEWDETAQDEVYVTEPVWFDTLLAARTFSTELTIYVDSVGEKVRVVSA